MGLETVNGIWDLNELWPLQSDNASESDDHHRVIKDSLVKTFPEVSAGIVTTAAALNNLNGLTGDLQAQFDSLSADVEVVSEAFLEQDESLAAISTVLASHENAINTLQVKAQSIFKTYQGQIDTNGASVFLPPGWAVTLLATNEIQIYHGLNLDVSDAVYAVTPTEAGYAVSIGRGTNLMLARCRPIGTTIFDPCGFYFQVTIR